MGRDISVSGSEIMSMREVANVWASCLGLIENLEGKVDEVVLAISAVVLPAVKESLQTIVDLGIDVSDVNTTATMRDALADAFKRVGSQITQAR